MAAMEEKKDEPVTSDNLVERDEFGRLLPGSRLNPLGPSINNKVKIDSDTLLESLERAEERHKLPLMDRIWDAAYKDNKFLAKVLDKFIANKGIDINQLTGGGQYVVNIQYFGDRKPADTAAESAKTIDIQGIDDDKGR